MNYKDSIHSSNDVFIFMFLLLISCTTQPSATSPNITLISIKNDTNQTEEYEVKVHYNGLKDVNYKFDVYIKNKSTDSIFVDPETFRYSFFSEIDGENNVQTKSISREEKIKQLKIQEDSVVNKKNPYSLSDKTVKEIVIEGLVQGTVGLLTGQNGEELELQREMDEYDWEQEQNLKLIELKNQLRFWSDSVFQSSIIRPNNMVVGKVLFPVHLPSKEIEVEIPLQGSVHKFRFKQNK